MTNDVKRANSVIKAADKTRPGTEIKSLRGIKKGEKVTFPIQAHMGWGHISYLASLLRNPCRVQCNWPQKVRKNFLKENVFYHARRLLHFALHTRSAPICLTQAEEVVSDSRSRTSISSDFVHCPMQNLCWPALPTSMHCGGYVVQGVPKTRGRSHVYSHLVAFMFLVTSHLTVGTPWTERTNLPDVERGGAFHHYVVSTTVVKDMGSERVARPGRRVTQKEHPTAPMGNFGRLFS